MRSSGEFGRLLRSARFALVVLLTLACWTAVLPGLGEAGYVARSAEPAPADDENRTGESESLAPARGAVAPSRDPAAARSGTAPSPTGPSSPPAADPDGPPVAGRLVPLRC